MFGPHCSTDKDFPETPPQALLLLGEMLRGIIKGGGFGVWRPMLPIRLVGATIHTELTASVIKQTKNKSLAPKQYVPKLGLKTFYLDSHFKFKFFFSGFKVNGAPDHVSPRLKTT